MSPKHLQMLNWVPGPWPVCEVSSDHLGRTVQSCLSPPCFCEVLIS